MPVSRRRIKRSSPRFHVSTIRKYTHVDPSSKQLCTTQRLCSRRLINTPSHTQNETYRALFLWSSQTFIYAENFNVSFADLLHLSLSTLTLASNAKSKFTSSIEPLRTVALRCSYLSQQCPIPETLHGPLILLLRIWAYRSIQIAGFQQHHITTSSRSHQPSAQMGNLTPSLSIAFYAANCVVPSLFHVEHLSSSNICPIQQRLRHHIAWYSGYGSRRQSRKTAFLRSSAVFSPAPVHLAFHYALKIKLWSLARSVRPRQTP